MYETITTTNSELLKNEVKTTVSNAPKNLVYRAISISCQTVSWIQSNQCPFLESGEHERFWHLCSGE